ncbi:MAG: DALR anticodon-binding domain-containing protein [Candidatus Xenobia bacterium]
MKALYTALQRATEAVGGQPTDVELSIPLQSWRGDYSCNVALQLASRLDQPAMKLAQRIVDELGQVGGIEQAKAVAPGFINLTLSNEGLQQGLQEVLTGDGWRGPGGRVVVQAGDHIRGARARLVGRAWQRMAGGELEELPGDGTLDFGVQQVEVGQVRGIEDLASTAAQLAVLLEQASRDVFVSEEALKRPGPHNPLFAVQYALQRGEGLRRHVQGEGDLTLLTQPVEQDLLRRVAEFSVVVTDAVRRCEPSWLAKYALRLARSFHAWYDRSPILAPQPELASARLALAEGVTRLLSTALSLLSATPPERPGGDPGVAPPGGN